MPVLVDWVIHDYRGPHEKHVADLLRRAVIWGEGLEEFDEHVRVANAVLARPSTLNADKQVSYWEIDETEQAYLQELLDEAVEYWMLCDYEHDEDPEDAWLGQVPRPLGAFLGQLLGF